jgi:hypothetical protein
MYAVGVSTNGVKDAGMLTLVLMGATDRRRWMSSEVLDRWSCIGDGSLEVECLGRGMDDRREVLPDFDGVVVEVDVDGPAVAAAAASSLTIRFLLISSDHYT